ncbi:MAG: hypothetical protein AAF806_23140 [Bacteroidota bacterium]
MEKARNGSLFGINEFAQAFEQFDEDAFFESLHYKVKNKSYFEQYKGFKLTLLILSYAFNVASAISASYAVYWLVKWLTGYMWAGYIVAGVFLFFLESIKRKSSTEFWQIWFFRNKAAHGWLGLSLFCLGLSIVSSGFGVKQGTEELAPNPELVKADSLINHYSAEIAKLEVTNTDLRENRDQKGQTYYKLYPTLETNTKLIADYTQKKLDLETKLEGQNEKLSGAYMAEVKMTAWTLVLTTLLMELLFEACIAYIWYYYHRSYVERKQSKKNVYTKDIQSKSKRYLNDIEKGYNENIDHSPTLSNDSPLQMTDLLRLVEQLQAENARLRTDENTAASAQIKEDIASSAAPIGFKYGQVRTQQNISSRLQKTATSDLYTVPHTYRKGGKPVTVHYNATIVRSRIGEYQKKLKAAKTNSTTSSKTIERYNNWLNYWLGKWEELEQKAQQARIEME